MYALFVVYIFVSLTIVFHFFVTKVYIAAISGHVPSQMVQCLSTFMEMCYIFRRNVITSDALKATETLLDRFHTLRQIFVEEGVRSSISLPRQHALPHYIMSIPLFGSPNGLCSSITKLKHIKAVKEPWRRSSRFKALVQMLRTIVRLEKLATLRQKLQNRGLLTGGTAAHFLQHTNSNVDDNESTILEASSEDRSSLLDSDLESEDLDDFIANHVQEVRPNGTERINDVGPDSGPHGLASIVLAVTPGKL